MPLLLAKHEPLALVQFDAHQDTWFDDGKRIDHGSFVARAVRDGLIDADRSLQIGFRTHAPEDFGIRIVYGHEVEEMRASDIASLIVKHTAGMPILRYRLPRSRFRTGNRNAGGGWADQCESSLGAARAWPARYSRL